ncbi:hypothetical protein IWQ60_000913 [Tieghemiomyces parasiticus]|uniref:Protein YIP n=1 Tax=Tieghemiomyces parasiticus TaxID=78921 RepID=A0A9W8ALJ4_9FUNG|nr:hypothetical protein IWQ60_000913 [Tieghemiomyces parasiticus]
MSYGQGPAHSVLFDSSGDGHADLGYDATGSLPSATAEANAAGGNTAHAGTHYDYGVQGSYAGGYYDQQQYQQDASSYVAGDPAYAASQAGAGGLQFYPSQYDTPGDGSGYASGYPGASTGSSYGAADHQQQHGGGYYGTPAGGPATDQGGPGFEPFPVPVSILAAFGSGGLPGEPPLLEELGVNFGHIVTKSLTVLNPARTIPKDLMDDADMSGPLVFCLLFGTFLLFSGKVHFGYIYGVGLLGCVSVYFLLNLMSESGVDGYRTTSVLGYSLLPMVLLSGVSLLLKLSSNIGYILSCLAVLWCTYAASTMFVTVLSMSNQRLLVAYPVGLFYTCFALMTVF